MFSRGSQNSTPESAHAISAYYDECSLHYGDRFGDQPNHRSEQISAAKIAEDLRTQEKCDERDFESGGNPEAVLDPRDLREATFKQDGEFWTKRGGADDAVNFAMKGQMAAAAVAKAATAGNLDEAGAQVKNLQANL